MRNLVFLLFLGVFGFVVAGWFLDWYSIAGVQANNGQHRVSIDFDTNKIKKDLDKGREKFQDTIHKVQHGDEAKTQAVEKGNPALRPNRAPGEEVERNDDPNRLPPPNLAAPAPPFKP